MSTYLKNIVLQNISSASFPKHPLSHSLPCRGNGQAKSTHRETVWQRALSHHCSEEWAAQEGGAAQPLSTMALLSWFLPPQHVGSRGEKALQGPKQGKATETVNPPYKNGPGDPRHSLPWMPEGLIPALGTAIVERITRHNY